MLRGDAKYCGNNVILCSSFPSCTCGCFYQRLPRLPSRPVPCRARCRKQSSPGQCPPGEAWSSRTNKAAARVTGAATAPTISTPLRLPNLTLLPNLACREHDGKRYSSSSTRRVGTTRPPPVLFRGVGKNRVRGAQQSTRSLRRGDAFVWPIEGQKSCTVKPGWRQIFVLKRDYYVCLRRRAAGRGRKFATWSLVSNVGDQSYGFPWNTGACLIREAQCVQTNGDSRPEVIFFWKINPGG